MKNGSGIIIALISLGMMTSIISLLYIDLNYHHDIAQLRNKVLQEKLRAQTACFWGASVAKAHYKALISRKQKVHTYQKTDSLDKQYHTAFEWKIQKNTVKISAKIFHHQRLISASSCDLAARKVKEKYAFTIQNWQNNLVSS